MADSDIIAANHHDSQSPIYQSPKPTGNTLPSQPYFFGRVDELKTIASALSPDSRTWGALIDGPGGIGKTALAIKAAHDAPAELFERKIFITAKVRELTAEGEAKLTDFTRPTYLAMLDELGKELGADGLEKLAPDERPNELRLALAGKKALIIFDNLGNPSQKKNERACSNSSRACPKATKPSSPPAAAPTWTHASCASTVSPTMKPCNSSPNSPKNIRASPALQQKMRKPL